MFNGGITGLPDGYTITTTGTNPENLIIGKSISVQEAAEADALRNIADLDDIPNIQMIYNDAGDEGKILQYNGTSAQWVAVTPAVYGDPTVDKYKEKGWVFSMIPPKLVEEMLNGDVEIVIHRKNGDDTPAKVVKTFDDVILFYDEED